MIHNKGHIENCNHEYTDVLSKIEYVVYEVCILCGKKRRSKTKKIPEITFVGDISVEEDVKDFNRRTSE